MDRSIQIDTFNRIAQVSRETIISLEKYEKMLIIANKSLNLIGSSTVSEIWNRHFLDSFQVIDFIEKNENKISFDTNLNIKNTKFKIDNINYKKKDDSKMYIQTNGEIKNQIYDVCGQVL